jgi:hypothetical protein
VSTTGTTGPPLGQRIERSVTAFLAAPASARPLAAFRIGVAAVVLVMALATAGNLMELYGSDGVVPRSVIDRMNTTGIPKLSWVVDRLIPLGVSESRCVYGLFAVYIASLVGLIVGWHTRWAAVVAWFLHLAMKMSGYLTAYGAEEFANIALFYCMWMPVGWAWSLDRRAGRVGAAPTAAARLALRVLQIHLCIIYFSSGVAKALGPQWWNGEAIWRTLMRLDVVQFDFSWLAGMPWLAKLLCWGTLVVEIFYPVFMWPRRTRTAWAAATIGLHLGIAVVLGLWTFSALMIAMTFSAFLVSPEPQAAPPLDPRYPSTTGRPTQQAVPQA